MSVTITDNGEYRAIPAHLKMLRGQRKYLKFINDFVGVEGVNDEIAIQQKRRIQLRRNGAY